MHLHLHLHPALQVVKCSAAVVRDWGVQGPAHDVLQDYLKANK